jgi:pyruvate/2-oxoglutarate dehydrogenase complex dihydrolipoamide dehydrogenase (E3) component
MGASNDLAGAGGTGRGEYPGAHHDAVWRRLVAPDGYKNPEPKPRYHLIVIGAGPAGLVTAIAAAGLGAKVALIERHAMGGDCLNVGCVPSKSLLELTARGGSDFDAAFAWLRSVRARTAEHDSVDRYRRAGVDVFLGNAKFVDTGKVQVGATELVGRRIVIATGARADLPPIPGLAESKPLTNESVFDLHARPQRLLVLGAGPIGCELAQAFARLSIDVHVIEIADRVLGNESVDASKVVDHALRDSGVTLHLGAEITKVNRRRREFVVTTPSAELTGDQLLVAAGRRANTNELNLAAAGVETDAAGQVVVDKYLRTSNAKIFAAGDVCAKLQFTHHADAHARIVVQNALFFPTATTRKLVIPRCTYTQPEVAQVGATRAELDLAGKAFDAYRVDYDDLDRGKTQGDKHGFVEVLTARSGNKILGATIVGRDAGEQIAPVCVAMANGLGVDSFAKTVLPYPTRAEALKRIGDQYNRNRLTPTAQRLFKAWFRWSR